MINILMLGGRRCGKTTVLASMCNSINQALTGANLRIEPSDENTRRRLSAAQSVIENKLGEFKVPLTRIKMDDSPTAAETRYSFSVFSEGRKPFETLNICDFPGEWITDAAKAQKVRDYIAGCQVIIIAVDTPYMFSNLTDKGFGAYHEEYNKTREITNFFKNSISAQHSSKDGSQLFKDKLILFVPLKCERYYHLTKIKELNTNNRDYMNEIAEAVKKSYGELLDFFKSTPELAASCTVAVTPILSAGGVDFVKFQKDEETGRLVAVYQEPEYLKADECGYSPKFCEQPMVYTLLYIMQRIIRANVNKQHTSAFSTMFGGKNSAVQIAVTVNTLTKRVKRFGDGYCIIQDPTHSIS